MKDILILDGARTPMAEYNGSFSDITAIDLGVIRRQGSALAQRRRARRNRPRHRRQRPADFGRRHLRRAPRRFESGRSEGSSRADAEPSLRLRHPVDHQRRRADSARRSERPSSPAAWRTCRRRRTSIRGARKGLKLGQGALEDSLMVALLDSYSGLVHGPDLGQPRAQVRHLARGAGRVRDAQPEMRGRGDQRGKVERGDRGRCRSDERGD